MVSSSKNLWALILGGSSGLGLASAKKLANLGHNICIVHRDRKSDLVAFEKAVNEMKGTGVQVLTFNKDALKMETISEVIEVIPHQSLHVLVHSIAKGTVKPLEELTMTDFEITVNAMALSWWEWTQKLIAAHRFNDQASNIAYTSEGNNKVWKGYGPVSVAKAALEALMRQMAVEYAPLGIKTNCIQAGVTQTKSFEMIPGSEQLAQLAQQRNPLKRLTRPEDVANAVALLCSPDGQWINGTVLKADGGESLR